MTELFLMLYTFYVLTVAAVACVGCLVYLGMRNCGYKRLHSGAIAVCFVAIIVSLVGCGEREPLALPEPSPFVELAEERTSAGWVTVFDVEGLRCVALHRRGVSCVPAPRPPIYGDVETAEAMPARCSTDIDCMQKFGGDGSPRRVRF